MEYTSFKSQTELAALFSVPANGLFPNVTVSGQRMVDSKHTSGKTTANVSPWGGGGGGGGFGTEWNKSTSGLMTLIFLFLDENSNIVKSNEEDLLVGSEEISNVN